jgi:hypothetical protein
MVSLASVRAVDFEPRVHLMSISERSERVELEMLPTRKFPPLQKMMGHCPSACRYFTLASAGNACTGLLELGSVCAFRLRESSVQALKHQARRSSSSIRLSIKLCRPVAVQAVSGLYTGMSDLPFGRQTKAFHKVVTFRSAAKIHMH